MIIYYICPRWPSKSALGARIRRAGIISGLENNGYLVRIIEVDRVKNWRPELYSYRGNAEKQITLLNDILGEGKKNLYIEGLPVAVSMRSLISMHHVNNYIHIDICDSWVKSVYLGLGATGATRNRFRSMTLRKLKKFHAVLALKLYSRQVKSISYIAEADLEADIRFVSKDPKHLIIGNSTQVNVGQVNWNRTGFLLCIGDWSYGPNISMLKNNIAWTSKMISLGINLELRVAGPNLPESYDLPEFVEHVGWVDNLSEIYSGALCSIALISEGAGVKNKVLESLSYGIPVIGTDKAFESVPLVKEMCLITGSSGPDLSDFERWSSQYDSEPPVPVYFSSWDTQVQSLIEGMNQIEV